jgi:hypothetical protein
VTIVLPIQPEESTDKELRQLYAYVRFGQINSTARRVAYSPLNRVDHEQERLFPGPTRAAPYKFPGRYRIIDAKEKWTL